MGKKTEIAWTTHTFNPHWGCDEVSPGCDNCYAKAWAKRTGADLWGAETERRFFGDKHWNMPRAWNTAAAKEGVRARVFCASMGDVFEDRRDLDAVRARLWPLIESTPALDWQLLTKRPENLRSMLPAAWIEQPRPNVWLGTSAEDQIRANLRIPILLQVPAVVRFISAEPLLGPIDLTMLSDGSWYDTEGATLYDCLTGNAYYHDGEHGLGGGPRIDWVIVGGESQGSRPFDLAWARSIRDQCQGSGTAFFMKQVGSRPFGSDGQYLEFSSFQQWVDKGKSWLREGHWVLHDARGRECRIGADMARARDEGAFPVKASPLLLLRDRKHGGEMAEFPEDLRVREFPAA